MSRISVFVDAANLFYVQQRLGWHVNPQRLLDHIVGNHELADAFWYTGVRTPPDPEQEKFLRWLTHAGYTVRRKSIKSFVNVERGGTVEKANLDVEIVIDMVTTADTFEQAALVSGDGDFEHVVEWLRGRGKRVRVYSIDPVIAFELRNAVGTHYVDFWSIRSEVERLEEAVPLPAPGPVSPMPVHNTAAMLGTGSQASAAAASAGAPGAAPAGSQASAPTTAPEAPDKGA